MLHHSGHGQRYDSNMSHLFFQQSRLPQQDINPELGSVSFAQQTAQIMARFELVVPDHRPDWVLVYGDVNFTQSCSLMGFVLHLSTLRECAWGAIGTVLEEARRPR